VFDRFDCSIQAHLLEFLELHFLTSRGQWLQLSFVAVSNPVLPSPFELWTLKDKEVKTP
jgi:hypothetical protein